MTNPNFKCDRCGRDAGQLIGSTCTSCVSKEHLVKLRDSCRPRFHITMVCPFCGQAMAIKTVHTDVCYTSGSVTCEHCKGKVGVQPSFRAAAERVWLEEDLIAELPAVTGNYDAVDLHLQHTEAYDRNWVVRALTEGKRAVPPREGDEQET